MLKLNAQNFIEIVNYLHIFAFKKFYAAINSYKNNAIDI